MTKLITTIFGVISGLLLISILGGYNSSTNLALEAKFEGFINEYTPLYTNEAEYQYRLGVFAENMKLAEELQEKNPLAEFGVTPFADRTLNEMNLMMELSQQYEELEKELASSNNNWLEERWMGKSEETGRSKSWTNHFLSIQNQKQCGSCWAFATTAVLEAHRDIRGQGKVKLSEQQLVDCEPRTHGCNGGISAYAYGWYKNHDACEGQHYPYVARLQTCNQKHCQALGVDEEVEGAGWVLSGEKGILDRVLNHGPVTVAVDASAWGLYKKGIVTGGCLRSGINHEVVVSGFAGGKEYPHYVIRNSWGTKWGNNGIIKVLYGEKVCGIDKYSFYPVM